MKVRKRVIFIRLSRLQSRGVDRTSSHHMYCARPSLLVPKLSFILSFALLDLFFSEIKKKKNDQTKTKLTNCSALRDRQKLIETDRPPYVQQIEDQRCSEPTLFSSSRGPRSSSVFSPPSRYSLTITHELTNNKKQHRLDQLIRRSWWLR